MTPWLDDGDVRLYHGDALEQLRGMPSESVQCIVTSPPFWGLRDYGTGSWTGGDDACDHVQRQARQDAVRETPGGRGGSFADSPIQFAGICGRCGAARVDQQIGLEETPDEWCARLVAVMREARRVLRSDGVCWIEVGDTYAANASGGGTSNADHAGKPAGNFRNSTRYLGQATPSTMAPGLKPKDLCGAPWLLAFALRADGWYLRSDTIWARPNPMPESVTDRPTKAHSYVFLLTKNARYYYDADAIRENHAPASLVRYEYGGSGADGKPYAMQQSPRGNEAGRNARSVWSIPTEPTPFAHFATFPQTLVERCIKAGTSEHGACSECGAPWRRITESTLTEAGKGNANGARKGENEDSYVGRPYETRMLKSVKTLGWEPSCAHDAPITPCLVCDPFMGSGTTALVARRLGRHAIGVELNPEYLAIAAKRLEQLSLLTGDAS